MKEAQIVLPVIFPPHHPRAYDSCTVLLFGDFARTNFRDAVPATPAESSDKAKRENLARFRARYDGVNLMKNGKYRAYVMVNRRHVHLGCFDTYEEARSARIAKEQELEALSHASPRATEGYIH